MLNNVATDPEILEAMRYMGVPSSELEHWRDVVKECFAEVDRVARPRTCHGIFKVVISEKSVMIGGMPAVSAALSSLLKNSGSCLVMAVTLGCEIDRRTGTLQRSDMARAMMFDACASVRADALCDRVERSFLQDGKHSLTPRFSPGYGDLDIAYSRGLIRLLDAERRIGVMMTAAGMMVPVKSVTAVAGFTGHRITASGKRKSGCAGCGMKNCAYRKKGSPDGK